MRLGEVERLRGELSEFVADVFASVPRRDQRRWGACCLRGLMLDGRRKSIQPMAERLPDGNMQALQQFVNQSPWDPLPVRQRIAQRLTEVVTPEVWVVDDVSFPKCGTASVGVARQYCGAVGKRANCQVAVSVHAATDTASCPLNWELYLPREWTDEPGRCRKAGVPDHVAHQEKWRLALGLLDTLTGWQLKAPVVVADAGYGVCTPFRLGLEERGLAYVLALTGKEVAHPEHALPHQPDYGGLGPPTLPRYRTPPHAVSVLASEAGDGRFTEVTWRRGSKGVMTSRFAVLTVRPAGKQSLAAVQEAGGGRNRQDAPTGYWISNLPVTTPVTDLVRWAKMRWRIEHDYRELKHGLGLDHFEGRTWRGWHHHVTLVTAAQAFLTLRRLDPKAHMPA
ncbi:MULTISPECIES: IS701 family transposase [Streptomyces]|uniref:IS701 family transposase n=1 Tax=Streptomyces TaxID=1883 RepID=UPI000F76A1B3|nr:MULTISPECIES: IS701 family transposase [unclassified Streptomyces]QCR51242.1 IS701 family transposase [Streptomyces sp. SGAir0924]RSS97817.1 IS701 family transposase [Streptomyces sp. WAC02707]